MLVRIQTGFHLPGARLRAPGLRRSYIYPHRSVRSWRPSAGRIVLALGTAAALVACVAAWHEEIFVLHTRLCVALLNLSGIDVVGMESVEIYPGLSAAPVPVTASVRLHERPLLVACAFGAALILLLLLQWWIPLARGFALFLAVLLVLSAVVVIFFPAGQFGASQFAQIWLRGEILVWLLLPLFSAAMATALHPVGLLGAAWAVAIQVYGIAWSAVRLAFGLGLMQFSGILFMPMLWFAFGLLADMVYIMVFYSLCVHSMAPRAWGRGAQ